MHQRNLKDRAHITSQPIVARVTTVPTINADDAYHQWH